MLNERQRLFGRLVVSGGMSQTDAYIKAFSKSDIQRRSAAASASALMADPMMRDYVDFLRQAADSEAILSRRVRMEMLSAMAIEAQGEGDIRSAVQCIAELNKMDQLGGASAGASVSITQVQAEVTLVSEREAKKPAEEIVIDERMDDGSPA